MTRDTAPRVTMMREKKIKETEAREIMNTDMMTRDQVRLE